MHIFRFWTCSHYSRSSESLDSVFIFIKPFKIFGVKFENWTIFRRKFEKFQVMGGNWKIRPDHSLDYSFSYPLRKTVCRYLQKRRRCLILQNNFPFKYLKIHNNTRKKPNFVSCLIATIHYFRNVLILKKLDILIIRPVISIF